MSARYTREALGDLDQISTYLAQRNPAIFIGAAMPVLIFGLIRKSN